MQDYFLIWIILITTLRNMHALSTIRLKSSSQDPMPAFFKGDQQQLQTYACIPFF